MQCAEFEDRLNRLLDHRLCPDDDPRLAAHAEQCEACAQVLSAQERLFAGLAFPSLAPSTELAAGVLAQRRTDRQSSRRRRRLGWFGILATAASLGGLALVAFNSGQRPEATAETQTERSPPIAANPAGTLAAAGLHAPSRPQRVSEERIVEYRRVLEDLAVKLGDSAELDEVSQSLTPSISPIRSSFGVAIDALRRTLPGRDTRVEKKASGATLHGELPVIG